MKRQKALDILEFDLHSLMKYLHKDYTTALSKATEALKEKLDREGEEQP